MVPRDAWCRGACRPPLKAVVGHEQSVAKVCSVEVPLGTPCLHNCSHENANWRANRCRPQSRTCRIPEHAGSGVKLNRVALRAATLASLLAGCAMPILAADSIDAVRVPRVDAVDIDISQDVQHRLVVRYRAPASVRLLDFLVHDHRYDAEVRTPLMKPTDSCGALVPEGITLRHGPGCEQGAAFVVIPQTMGLYAMNEPAQPSSDGGVIFYTGYYAAAAPGLDIRWRFTPAAGDYGIDDSRRHDATWQVVTERAHEGPKAPGDQRDDEAWLKAQHAAHYVFLGHTPMTQSGGLLWVRDPALAPVIVDTVSRAGPLAWDAYARATGRQPEGQVTVVMLSALASGQYTYHGDRTEGNMLRLSFAPSDTPPDARDLASWTTFVAHETAHLWNHGVFRSDTAQPWLHEGDADWAALNAMHAAGLLSDRLFTDQLQSHVDRCLAARGERVAAVLNAGWSGEDEPYACGLALQLLGFARVHAAHPEATPLEVWGELHGAHPSLNVRGFAQFFDDGADPVFQRLLLDDRAPFASTYRADLAAWLPLSDMAGEPAAGSARRQLAFSLMTTLGHADCGERVGFTLKTSGDQGEFVLAPDLACRMLPAGAHLTYLAGIPVIAQPRAAWRAVQLACASTGRYEAGFDGHASVMLDCPKTMPGLPPQVVLPDDVLVRLGLTQKTF